MIPRGFWGGASALCAALLLSACGGGGGGEGGGIGSGDGGLFLRGSFNDWDARESHRFSETDGGDYVITVSLSRGAHEFKIADRGWSAPNNFGGDVVGEVGSDAVLVAGANTANRVLVTGEDGEYVFRFNPETGKLGIMGNVVADGAYRPGGGAGETFNNLRTYQVMVESFQDGDDSVNYNIGWGPSEHKGDLKGIINALDYIVSLNVNALWLTPIFDSTPASGGTESQLKLDATGYYARDFFKVDPKFGTMDDARTLVSLAHDRGMSVFFDGVFGHWHRDGVVPFRDGVAPGQGNAIGDVGYEADYSDPDTLEFFKTVATFWIDEVGIDGWRLDQAYQVPIDEWRKIREATDAAALRNGKSTVYLFGEFWRSRDEINREAYGPESNPALESAFDFPGRELIFQNVFAAANPRAEQLRAAMLLQLRYPDHARPGMFIGNHDIPRFGDLLQRNGIGTDDADPGTEYWARHTLALSFLASHTGPVFTYYGEEIGRQLPGFDKRNGSCGTGVIWCDDHVSRDNGKIADLNPSESALRDYYAETMSLRAEHPALWNGAGFNLRAEGNLYADLKVWSAPDSDEAIVHLMNLGNSPLTVTLSESELHMAGGRATLMADLRNGAQTWTARDGNFEIVLHPFSSRLLSVAADSSGLTRNALATGRKGTSAGLWADSRMEVSPAISGLGSALAKLDFPLALPNGRKISSRLDPGRIAFSRRSLSASDVLAELGAPDEPAESRPLFGGNLRMIATDDFAYEKRFGKSGPRFALEHRRDNPSGGMFSRFANGGEFFPNAGESPYLELIPDGTRVLGEFPLSAGRFRAMIYSGAKQESPGGARAAALEWRGEVGGWRLGAHVGGLREDESFLGAYGSGPLELGDSETVFGGLWGERQFGDAALFASADGGLGRTTSPGKLIRAMRARTSAFAGGVRVGNVLYSGDRLVLTARHPLRAVGVADLNLDAERVSLAPDGRELSLEAAYYFFAADSANGIPEWRGALGMARARHPGHDESAKPETAGFVSFRMEF